MNAAHSAVLAGLWLLAHCVGALAAVPRFVSAAVADPARPAQQVSLDPWRKPAEVLAFSGVKPGNRVADFMPGNAYFTRLLSDIVGPSGRVYAFVPDEQVAHCAPGEIAGTRALAAERHYANVQLLYGAAQRFAVAEPLDLVWIAQDYHDLHDKFMGPTDVARFNAAVFRALKPGGTFLVIDHAAEAGSGLRDTETLHRIDRDSIVREVTAAGFALQAESDVLRNRADTHRLAVFNAAIRHRTDQVVLRFRKPPAPAQL